MIPLRPNDLETLSKMHSTEFAKVLCRVIGEQTDHFKEMIVDADSEKEIRILQGKVKALREMADMIIHAHEQLKAHKSNERAHIGEHPY